MFLFLYKKAYHDFILMIKKKQTEYVLFPKNIMILIFVKSMKTQYDSFVKNIIMMIFKKHIMVISLKIIIF